MDVGEIGPPYHGAISSPVVSISPLLLSHHRIVRIHQPAPTHKTVQISAQSEVEHFPRGPWTGSMRVNRSREKGDGLSLYPDGTPMKSWTRKLGLGLALGLGLDPTAADGQTRTERRGEESERMDSGTGQCRSRRSRINGERECAPEALTIGIHEGDSKTLPPDEGRIRGESTLQRQRPREVRGPCYRLCRPDHHRV